MERIVFLDRETVQTEIRRPDFAHEWQDYPYTAPEQIGERLREATIAVTNKVPLRRATLEKFSSLRLIVVSATGVDCVETEYCREKGIVVCNVPNYADESVPEHVLMLILALQRNLIAYREALAAGRWQQSKSFTLLDYPLRDLKNSTLGIVGYGTLGRAVEKLAHAFGMQVLVAERKGAEQIRAGRTEFSEVLRRSDIITLHCPLTNETRNLIGAPELKLMPSHALLINCARGGVVNEQALAEALREGKLGGAGVDVLTTEPPTSGNPLMDLSLPNLIVTPHVAWASVGAVRVLAEQVVANMEAFMRGAPQNRVA